MLTFLIATAWTDSHSCSQFRVDETVGELRKRLFIAENVELVRLPGAACARVVG